MFPNYNLSMTAIASELLQVKRQINTQEIQEHRNRSGTVNYLQVQTNITNITHDTNDHQCLECFEL